MTLSELAASRGFGISCRIIALGLAVVLLFSLPNPSGGQSTAIIAPKLVRQATTKVLYPDRTQKVVAETNFYSDDSRVYHGGYVEYYPSGRPFCRGSYTNGKRHGDWEFLRRDGTVAKKGRYDLDKAAGTWQYLRQDGKTLREESYKNGVPDGIWRYLAADGTTAREIEFADGRIVTR